MELATRGPAMSSPSAGAVGCARTATRCHRVRFGRAPVGRDERRASAAGRARTRATVIATARVSSPGVGVPRARRVPRDERGRLPTAGGFRGLLAGRTFVRENETSRFARRGDAIGDSVVPAATAEGSAESSIPASLPTWRRHASVACVMLAVFLHLLGFTVTGPITPSLVRHFALHPSQVGYLTSAYPLGMFFALFAWPRLSDKVGRKPILALSLLGVGCGLVAQARCVSDGGSLGTFLALRVASGAFAGASPIVKAYLADVATARQLPRFMAWREACCTLAFIAGPTLGAWFFHGTKSLSACIYVTGFSSVAAAALVAAVMVEGEAFQTPPVASVASVASANDEPEHFASKQGGVSSSLSLPSTAAAAAAARAAGAREAEAAGACPLGTGLVTAVATICVVSFLYNAGQSTFDSFFPMYASGTLGMGPTRIGATLTSLAAVSFGVSAFVFSRVQEALGLTLTAAAGLGLVAAGLCGVGLAGSEAAAVAAAAVYVSGIPLFTPAVPILLMQCVPKTRRGAVMGLDSAVNAVARIATPVAFGKALRANAEDGGLNAPFLAAGTVVALAALVVVVRRWSVLGGFRGGGRDGAPPDERKGAARETRAARTTHVPRRGD